MGGHWGGLPASALNLFSIALSGRKRGASRPRAYARAWGVWMKAFEGRLHSESGKGRLVFEGV
jgi:hypothetical protein